MLLASVGARSRRWSLAALAAGLMTATLVAPTAGTASTAPAPVAPPVAASALPAAADRAERAERALAAVEAALAHRGAARASAGQPTELTLLLRDLAVDAAALPPADRRRARDLLARPTSGGADSYGNPHYGKLRNGKKRPVGRLCGENVCVHWVETGHHKVKHDGSVKTVPGWVQRNLDELEHVHRTYVEAGYRPVLPDAGKGGDARADIYLANVGMAGIYGYCTTDQRVPSTGPKAVWAYCVLDNDFSRREFPTNSPLGNMQVTAAHEYFHAVQFAHDLGEDGWFMEATATWAEDELYDDVNDNLNYLPTSPLREPRVPLDTFSGLFQYGEWIFFRFLTERLPDAQGAMPTLVRDMWAKAAGTAENARGQYSLEAIRATLTERGVDFTEAFGAFADANRHPKDSYSEAVANGYPVAKPGRFDQQRGWQTTKLRHLTSASKSIRPTASSTTLTLRLDLPPTAAAFAVVSVYPKPGDGTAETQPVTLDADGDGTVTLPFTRAAVSRVDVTLVNASTRMRCRSGGDYSCNGTPKDDRMPVRFKALLG